MAYQEIKGSRRTTTRNRDRTAVTLGVTDDKTSCPARGDDFTEDSGDNELLRRKCFHIDFNPEVIPGLYVCTAQYANFLGYSA